MSDEPSSEDLNPQNSRLSRRALIKRLLGVGAAGLAIGSGLISFSGVSYAAAMTKAERDAMSPADVVKMLQQGNERFRNGKMERHNFLAEKRSSVSGQYPAAAILGCIDSRAPAEILMDMGLGEAFNVRVAGNVSNDDVVGSLEYSCAVAGAKVILVMGHTSCGAVKGAIDEVELGNLSGLLDEIKPAVEATEYSGKRTSKNAEFVNLVAVSNVRRAMAQIRQSSPVLVGLEKKGQIKIVGAMYHLKGGRLELLS